MKAIIWDLDGTLIDSYEVISTSIQKALSEFNIYAELNTISKHIQIKSVTSFLQEISNQYNLDINLLYRRYFYYNDKQNTNIKTLPNAYETLKQLTDHGIKHFIYTHKSNIAHDILKHLNLYQFFTKVLTIDDGFKRKPDPEAINYLIDTYKLSKNNVYYVGDRSLDIESAINAGIKSVLYIPSNSPVQPAEIEDYVIYDLLEMTTIFQ